MVLTIIFLVLFAVCLGAGVYFTVNLVGTPMIEVDYKKHFKKVGLFVIGAVIAFVVMSFGIYQWLKAAPDTLHVVELVIGAVLFSGGLLTAINCFILHYYGRNIPEKLDKWLFRIQIIGFVIAAVFFFIWTNGLAPYLSYPLANGISFSQGLVNPNTGKPNIAFYAICILSGAILVYFICDHYMYKEYGQHGTLESTFFVAFPAGIIGARIWYVVGNWAKEFNYGNSYSEIFNGIKVWAPLAIWDGGITILGGAAMGIIVGAAWYMWANKGKSIWIAFDMIVPCILVAQAIGRWGNFFNCEVHGDPVALANWKWLPEIIWRNGQYSQTLPSLVDTEQMYLPLFFIEAIINLLGYFILAHVFGKALRKYTELGDLGFGYIIWYGLTRVLLEPLRTAEYKMGEDGYWSWVWAMIFVLLGTAAIVGNHIVRYILRKKHNTFKVKPYEKKLGVISSMAIIVVAAGLIALGAYLMTANPFKVVVEYNGFNEGVMALILGISVFLCLGISIPMTVEAMRGQQNA